MNDFGNREIKNNEVFFFTMLYSEINIFGYAA